MANHLGGDPEPDFLLQNPYLSGEELEVFQQFFRLFENELGLASITKMLAALEQLEELNTGVIRKILTWARDKSGSNCEFSSCKLPGLRAVLQHPARATRNPKRPQALFQANIKGAITRIA